MRTKIFFLTMISIVTMAFISCSSKTNKDDSIEFLEIPVKGDVYSFGDKLSQRGYDFIADDNIYCQLVYTGIYLNKHATIRLDYEEETKKIKAARVIFEGDLPNATTIINEYTEKYGECNIKNKYSGIYYSWTINGGRIMVSTWESPMMTIEYYNY